MIYRIPAASLTRAPAGAIAPVYGKAWYGLALACLFLAGCAATGTPSTLASEQDPPPKEDPAIARAVPAEARARPAATSAPSQDPVVLQRRRQAIAKMLESSFYYRTFLDVKLINAKLAGPFAR
jgi:hypothetical protein